MESKETELRPYEGTIMLDNIDYYKYIFKKTEKIASAVFYVLRNEDIKRQNDVVVTDLESATQAVLQTARKSLSCTSHTIRNEAVALRHALVHLESALTVACAARIIAQAHLTVFAHEIDSVYRSIKKYTDDYSEVFSKFEDTVAPRIVRERKQSGGLLHNSVGGTIGSTTGVSRESRRDRVLTVIKDRGEATIKDVVEVVTDCSEKTIQRELISLIKDNVIIREGERRWSKYRLV